MDTALRRWVSLWVAALCLAAPRYVCAEVDVRRDATVNAIEEVMPCVVNISTETIVEIRDPLEHLFKDFFGPNWGRRPQQSLGSGVIIDETGYILTNFHVVRRANKIAVTLSNNKSYLAKLIGVAHKSDVALLKIEAKGEKLKAIKLAPDDDLLLGETVVALGNPFGLGGSVSRGILSSRTRRPPTDNEPMELDLSDWLQTDAAINPGNSGGPLINLRAELIGLNVAVFREGQGIGFAIPVKRISEALSETFTPEGLRGLWFGARFAANAQGVHVTAVEPGSPAEKAGLKLGDKVLRINEKTPKNVIEVNRELVSLASQRAVALTVQRKSERRELTARLIPEREFFNAELIQKKLGATLQEITPETAPRIGPNRISGFVVAEVEPDGPAAESGLRPGHLIQAFDGQVPPNLTVAAKLLYGKKVGDNVTLKLLIPRGRGNLLYSATADVILR